MNFGTLPSAERPWAWLGVDIGLDGGLAVLRSDDVPEVMRMPTSKQNGVTGPCVRQLVEFLDALKFRYRVAAACEKPFIKGRQAGQLTIGKNWGIVLAAFHAAGLEVVDVPPREWQDEVLEGIVDPDPKVRAAIYVKRTYPDVNLKATKKSTVDHDGIIDALCIADWRRRRTGG